MASNPVHHKWTVEEYLAYEEETGVKHEYLDGEIYAMSGGTENHSIITMNTGGELTQQLRGSTCRSHSSDMRVKISDQKYIYPDLSVVCGEAKFADDKHTMLTNPTLVVEVTSISSRNYDMGMKSELYRSLPSLQAYLTIDQTRIFVQLYTRHDDSWILKEFDHLEDSIPLPMINATLPLSEIYRDITFETDS